MAKGQDAADHILKLPKAEQDLRAIADRATEALIMAAEVRGPLMHARRAPDGWIHRPRAEGSPR